MKICMWPSQTNSKNIIQLLPEAVQQAIASGSLSIAQFFDQSQRGEMETYALQPSVYRMGTGTVSD
jgi:hypothetical protein